MENVGVEQQSMKFLLNPVWISGADLGAMLQLKDDLKKYKHTPSPFIRGLPHIHWWSTSTTGIRLKTSPTASTATQTVDKQTGKSTRAKFALSNFETSWTQI